MEGRSMMGKLIRSLVGLLVLLALVFAGWTWLALKFTYSTGERAGYVQKFSRKGWLAKTWEGEIAMVNLPGTMQERFSFTVRRQDVADKISGTLGRRVVIHYEQHRFIPTHFFGDTEYFVTNVTPVSDEPARALEAAGAPAR
jgi:hypothetical protein